MRKLMILCAACLMTLCAMAQYPEEINAVKFVQNETTDWYLLSSNPEVTFDVVGNPVINGKTYTIDLFPYDGVETTFEVAPEDTWYTLRSGATADNWNTICVEQDITAIDGATFWNVVSETEKEFTLEQVSAPFPAGVGYIIRYTKSELKAKFDGGFPALDPVTATPEHPIQGNFAEITCDEDGQNELVNNYVVYGNQLCKVTGWVTMADHRAYVIAGKAPSKAPALHGAPRMTMPKPNSTPTEFGTLPYEGKARKGSFKVIENGQFRIVRDNKMYNAQGIEL